MTSNTTDPHRIIRGLNWRRRPFPSISRRSDRSSWIANAKLSEEDEATVKHNIQICREAIVFFTALAGAKGLAGHSGDPYHTVPEMLIVPAFIAGGAPIVPVIYDEAGHRVATSI